MLPDDGGARLLDRLAGLGLILEHRGDTLGQGRSGQHGVHRHPGAGQAFPSGGNLPDELLQAIAGAREGLHEVIAMGIADGTFAVAPGDGAGGRMLSIAAWAVVHGLTLLLIDDIVQRDQGPDLVARLPERVVALFVAGLRAHRG